jgi:Pvc16 N-terminal domain
MSNHLAIATVTAALGEVVYGAISTEVSGAEVSYSRPAAIDAEEDDVPARANLFLYGVTPNAAWRNTDLPTRRAGGELSQRPHAALDLHYLISFYGNDALLEPQRMLGSVVRALHSRPALTRTDIVGAIDSYEFLEGSDLHEAPEAVRFTPVSLSLEELSKLWSVLFQTPYALTVAYQGTVVLIEAEEAAPRPTLPVRGRNVYVVPLRRPEVAEVAEAGGPGSPILPTGVLVLRGRGLAGDITRVRLGTAGDEWEPSLVTAREVRLPLSTVPTDRLRAGIQGVQVVHRMEMGTPAMPHRGEESNVAPFILRPVVRRVNDDPNEDEFQVQVLPPVDVGDPRRVQVRVAPDVGPRQRAELLLNAVGDPAGPAFLFPAPEREEDTDTLVFDAPGLAAGRYLVRVRIDGAESLLEADAPPSPGNPDDRVYVRPWVEVP